MLLIPHGSTAQARALMRVSDWGLVSLTAGVIRYAYPSKTATYLSEALPLLAAVEPGSALARDVDAWGVGVHLPLDDPSQTAAVLASLPTGREHDEARRRARETWDREFTVEGRLARWDALLDDVVAGSRVTTVG